jgi:hypothetical protein
MGPKSMNFLFSKEIYQVLNYAFKFHEKEYSIVLTHVNSGGREPDRGTCYNNY